MIGIYKITNPLGQVYVGASKNIYKRIKSGYKNKVGKRKRFIHLSLDKYGIDNHKFEIIEECELSILNIRERFWQEKLNSLHPNGLNRNLVACLGKRQISCKETINIIRNKKIGSVAWNKGIPTSESTKETINRVYSALKRDWTTILMDYTTGVFYYGYRDAAKALGKPVMTVKNNITAPNKNNKINKTNIIIT